MGKALKFFKNLWKYNNSLIAVLVPLLLLPLIVIDGENDIQDPTDPDVMDFRSISVLFIIRKNQEQFMPHFVTKK